MIKEGSRVHCKDEMFGIDGLGTVNHIDKVNQFNHHMKPVQVLLDEPYDDSGQRVVRFSFKELKEVVD